MSNISRRSFMAASGATLLSVLLAGCDSGTQEPEAEGGDAPRPAASTSTS